MESKYLPQFYDQHFLFFLSVFLLICGRLLVPLLIFLLIITFLSPSDSHLHWGHSLFTLFYLFILLSCYFHLSCPLNGHCVLKLRIYRATSFCLLAIDFSCHTTRLVLCTREKKIKNVCIHVDKCVVNCAWTITVAQRLGTDRCSAFPMDGG